MAFRKISGPSHGKEIDDMKRNLLTVFVSCIGIGVFAQGQVQFRTYYAGSTPPVDAKVYWDDGIIPLDNSNPEWRAALLGGPTTLTAYRFSPEYGGNLPMLHNPATTTLTWVNFRGSPNQGYVSVTGVAREIEGVNWGGTALVQMVAWQGPYTTWTDAFYAVMSGTGVGVMIGVSNPLTLTLPSSPVDPNLTYLQGLQSFTLVYVPEPSALALSGLGAAVPLILRRRN